MLLLEKCRRFKGYCVQSSVELEPEDVSLLERFPHIEGVIIIDTSKELGHAIELSLD